MPQKTNLNVNPYYDDFDADKNFYKVLFRPGYSIQGRELTQLQSILQNQIESFGKYSFKQGELVIPGEVSLNTKLNYVKLSSVSEVAVNEDNNIVYKKYDITQLIGQTIQGLTSGVEAVILSVNLATDSTADTLYVNYITSGNSSQELTFRQGETLEVVDGVNTPLMVVGTDGSVLPTSISVRNPDTDQTITLESPAMGYASAVKVEEGIYFVNGYFVKNKEELLVVDSYYNKPSAKIGFTIVEDIVTPEKDLSLYDNAIGSSNQTAPGAHRLRIQLQLKKFELNAITDKNFIQIITVSRGAIQKKVTATDYNLLEQTLARRTYDESGDYVVEDFSVNIREYSQRNQNNGVYSADEFGLYNGLSESEASRKMVASVGPGKAYIKGYEIVNKETKFLELNKARESTSSENVIVKASGLPTFNITNVFGSVPLNKEGSQLTAYPTIFLSNLFNDGYVGLNGTESNDNYRSSISRRGKFFDSNIGIKTLTLQIIDDDYAIETISKNDLENTFANLWYVRTRAAENIVDSVEVLSFSKVFKPQINPAQGESAKYLEITVAGNKKDLENVLIEYDETSFNKRRVLFLSEQDATSDEVVLNASEIVPGRKYKIVSASNTNWTEIGADSPDEGTEFVANNATPTGQGTVIDLSASKFAEIIDYSNTITPVIGTIKPNNFYLQERGDGFNPDSDIILSKGVLDQGGEAYNAKYALSYFDPQFYTKIVLDSIITQGTYDVGEYVYGLTSKAYGVVEGASNGVYSTGNILFIKTLSGKFLPGETIRDESGNLLNIAKENTISHLIVQKRGNGYPSTTKIKINGVVYNDSQILLSRLGQSIYKADILDKASVSEEYTIPPVVTLDTDGATVAEQAVIVPVLNRNTVTTYAPNNVKSLGCNYGSGGINQFTADVILDNKDYANLSSVTDFTFFGSKGNKFLESTSFNSDASSIVSQGDLVQFSDVENNVIRGIVQYATIQKGSSKTRIYLDETLYADVSNTSVVLLRPKLQNINSGTLLFPTGGKEVKQISAGGDDSKIKYYFRRDFVTAGSTGGGIITFAAQLPFGTQRFTTFNEKNYVITVLDKKDADLVENGDLIYIDPDSVSIVSSTDTASGLTSGSLTIELPSSYFNTNVSAVANFTAPELKLTATVEVENAKPRLKTAIKNRRIVVDSSGDRVVPLRGTNYDSDVVEKLSYSDVYKIRYIYEGTSTQPPEVDNSGNLISGKDVTNRFTFDNGQRDTIYDVSRIVIRPGFEPTVGQLIIGFDYFEHSQGDFATIDSYLHEAGVLEDEIPTFNSSVLGNINLKNVIDFRPKVNSNTIVPGYQDTSSLEVTSSNFTGSGSVVSSTPAPDANLEYTFSFSQVEYLDRIDGIFLNKKGEFVVKEGNSSLNPSKPDDIKDAIPLFYAYIPAFTPSSKNVRITPVEHRRYTMKDIGKLEKRIERLEYYTTLSILEQQALNMQVKDSVGLDRFKSGFFVDNFESHSIGFLSSPDYRCSIDSRQSVLRPQSKEDSIDLKELYTREDQRTVAGYKKSGDIVTLPYTELKLLGNDFASKTINPNPFVVFQYVGEGHLSPQIDQWYADTIEPLIIDTNTNLYNIFLAKEDPKESLSSLYNSYIVNWVGTSTAFNPINSLGENNSLVSKSSVQVASVGSSSNVSPQNNDLAKGVISKKVGENIVSSSLQFFARSKPIKFVIERLKPNTNISVFLEGRNINRWVNPDLRFTGTAGNSLSAFNGQIKTDSNGNASGLILLPFGYAPKENSLWEGDISTVDYDTSSEELKFTTGELTFRFTSSDTNEDKTSVDTYAEIKYYASGLLPQNPSSIVSTKPSYFKSNEGVQFVDSNTDNPIKPNPLAQIFKVENYEGGVFVTGVDLFFKEKSATIPARVYLTNVNYDKPAKNIVPGTERSLSPETYLKCFSTGSVSVKKGEYIVGSTSAASGPISRIIDKNGVELVANSQEIFSLTNEQVYTLVLSNHNGKSFRQNEDLEVPSITTANAANGTSLKLKIAKDSGKLSDIIIKETGSNYDSAVLTIESPQLPGGSVATAQVSVSNGKIYNVDIAISGFGYTEAPSVVIKGVGNGAGGCVIETLIEIDTPAVRMGIATDFEGLTESTTPTNFMFDYPVYLENNTEYALVIETDSTDYKLWSSKLGETDISTSTVITSQPSLGSLYKSQNTENWTEDLDQDLKFNMYRAEFDTSRTAELLLKNSPLRYEKLTANAFETDATAGSTATSNLFRGNANVVKVNHRDHGFEGDGNSYVFYRGSGSVGGLNSSVFNTNLFEVVNSGIDSYNIIVPGKASSNDISGGDRLYATYNRKYETLYPQVRYITVSGTKIETFVKTTNIVPVDSAVINYNSYSQNDYEKTFLNETHYFNNQKVIGSPINEILNDLDNSLVYKINLTSDVSYLSPVIDLSSCSVKTVSNRIENPVGTEKRYGRQNQILEFYPVYTFALATNTPDITYTNNKSIKGVSSEAAGQIVKIDGTNAYVKLKTKQGFIQGEELQLEQFVNDNNPPTITVGTSPSLIVPVINSSTQSAAGESITITARNPITPTVTYDNIISGRSIIWNRNSRELTLRNDFRPINDDYTGRIIDNDLFTRASSSNNQSSDIFRVGDIIEYPAQPDDESLFMEVSKVRYENGVDYVEEDTSNNSSTISKYVTKEVYIASPATSIDVHLLANLKEIENIKVLYKFKKSSSQENFDDIEWIYFNDDGYPDTNELANSNNTISSVVEKQSSYQDLKYSVSDLPEFSSFAIKVVMLGSDPVYVPKVQDIRAVAGF